MNLFEVFARIGLKDDGFESGLEKATTSGKKFSSAIGSSIGSAVAKGAKIATGAIVTVGTGLSAITGMAVKGFAEYEQLVGGVDTLFKNSSLLVQSYAENAYKTAGMSANEYMETVTGFSASLLQSLGGDTEKAAKVADLALTDMSDNANKMGTSMESIKYAYQGFAKQNYTMLDNLKLGYGGTKTEMERLLVDAQKLSGVKYNISNLSDVYTAINVIQTEIGITGTTAQEASETISGSFSMMKSAWKNLSVGLADSNADVDTLVDNFVGAVGVVGNNILPTIETTINGLGTLIEKIAPQIAEKIPDIVIGVLPKLIGAATSTIAVLLSEIVKNIPKFIEVAEQIAVQMLEAIGENIPILKPFTDALALVVENFNKILPVVLMVTTAMIAYKGAMAISNVINMAKNAMQGLKVAQMALNFAMSLNPIGLVVAAIAALTVGVIYLWNTNEEFRTALINAWENIKEVAISVWESIANFFTVTIPEAFNTAKQSVLDFITNVIEWFKALPENIYNMVQSAIEFFQELPYNIGYLIGVIIAHILKFGLDIINWAKETIPQFVNNVITFFKELPPKIGEWFVKTWEKFVKFGKDIINFAKTEIPKFIDTTVEWFKSLPEKIWEFLLQTFTKVTQWGSDLWEWARTEIPQLIQNIADFFLELPSKVADVGKNIVDGIWNGIKNSWSGLVEGASGLIEGFKSVFTGGDGFDTHSPSKWSEQVFKNVMQGGEIGIGIGTSGLLKSAVSSVNGFKNEFEDIGIKSKLSYSGVRDDARGGNRQGRGFGDIIINISADVLQKTDNYLLSKNIANEIKRQINSGERGVNYAY